MKPLSVDYPAVVAGLAPGFGPRALGAALLDELGRRYTSEHGEAYLQVFEYGPSVFLFDFASAEGLVQEDRTVAAWATTPADVAPRDKNYQRGFPMAEAPGPSVDRGHLIPNLSGGEFGPNIFRQDRALNRGWSEEGKRYRALEREAAATVGSFYFGHLLYRDETAHPSEVEIGVLRGTYLHAERFDNRPPAPRTSTGDDGGRRSS